MKRISDDMVRRAQERMKRPKQSPPETTKSSLDALNGPLHPLLTVPTTAAKNILKNTRNFDPSRMNPYISAGTGPKRALVFNKQGKYIEQAEEMRLREAEKAEKERIRMEKLQKGLVPLETTGEDAYIPKKAPLVEWWDQPYLRDRDYNSIDQPDRLVVDNEACPISIYIQHPVLLEPVWEKHMPADKPMYLTKKEQKRIRRNERLVRLKEKQDRIKLGLDPPPPPKVKLSNLMSVLANEAIKDPTAVEKQVRRDVERRLQNHLAENERRKLTKEQRKDKIELKQDLDLSKGYFTTVYKINQLTHPQHIFKVDMNAKQLGLVGMCLINPEFTLVVVEGGHKSIAFYKKLLTKRIDWGEHECRVVWEGQLGELGFKRWSMHKPRSVEETREMLGKFGRENYVREVMYEHN